MNGKEAIAALGFAVVLAVPAGVTADDRSERNGERQRAKASELRHQAEELRQSSWNAGKGGSPRASQLDREADRLEGSANRADSLQWPPGSPDRSEDQASTRRAPARESRLESRGATAAEQDAPAEEEPAAGAPDDEADE